jgi:hypothetical protein
MLLRKRRLLWSLVKMLMSARRTQPPVDCLWSLEPSFPGFKRKSLIIFLFLTWYCLCIHLYVTICMKLDPGMHIGLHLVFFEKQVWHAPTSPKKGFVLEDGATTNLEAGALMHQLATHLSSSSSRKSRYFSRKIAMLHGWRGLNLRPPSLT